MPAKCQRRRRGIFLIELIVVIGIMAVVAVVAMNVIMMSFNMQRDARAHDTLVHRVDNAVDRMRRDVWAARDIRVTDDKLEVEGIDGAIAWEMKEGSLVRTPAGAATNDRQQWQKVPAFHFANAGSVRGLVRVMVDAGEKGGKRDELTLVSEYLAAGGGK